MLETRLGMLIVLALLLPAPAPAQRQVALTFDDLPFVGPRTDLATARQATARLLEVLDHHQATAVAFVTETKLQVPGEVDARLDLLRDWLRRGHDLGNHTFDHANLNAVELEDWRASVVKGEPLHGWLRSEAGRSSAPFFRHPMTYTGGSPEKKAAAEAFLAGRGYRIAPFTVENSDFIFNVIYVQALAEANPERAERVAAAYLSHTEAVFQSVEAYCQTVFGREPAQILLLHANELNAATLEPMLRRLAERGYRLIGLPAALEDPVADLEDLYTGPRGPSWLYRWAIGLGQRPDERGVLPGMKEEPDPPGWILEAFQQWRSSR